LKFFSNLIPYTMIYNQYYLRIDEIFFLIYLK
jgi:hypothetical protein